MFAARLRLSEKKSICRPFQGNTLKSSLSALGRYGNSSSANIVARSDRATNPSGIIMF